MYSKNQSQRTHKLQALYKRHYGNSMFLVKDYNYTEHIKTYKLYMRGKCLI